MPSTARNVRQRPRYRFRAKTGGTKPATVDHRPWPRLAAWSLGASLILSLVACGGDGGDGGDALPTPTRSITFSPTRSPSLPERPTGSADEAPTNSPSAPGESEQTAPPTRPSPTPPPSSTSTRTASASATTSAPSETLTATSSPSPQQAANDADDAGNGVPAWVWWLLAAAVVAAAVGIPLAVWARRRHAWADRVAADEAEVAWFARELVPELRRASVSTERLAGAWTVGGRVRVQALEDELTALESRASDGHSRSRARALRDAVREARQRIDALTASTSAEPAPPELDAVAARLEAALAAPVQR